MCKRIRGLTSKNSVRFALLSDTHYTVNGIWEDTRHELVDFSAIIHLGDLTDGMLPLELTREYEDIVKSDLRRLARRSI